MTAKPNPSGFPSMPSLLDSIGAAPAGIAGPGLAARARPALRLSDAAARNIGIAAAAIGVLAGAAIAWNAYRPIWAPDFSKAPLKNVLNFALLDADFNRLPLEERMRLILDLAKRLQGMGAGDSALLAAFAAGISGEARRQLEDNIRRLGIDMMASWGARYAEVPETDRAAFLEATAVEWSRLGDQLTGRERNLSDSERLDEMREQSRRDAERGRATDTGLTPDRAGNLFRWVQNDINQNTSANQRAQTSVFVRDMTRVLRGRDPNTNQPKRD